MKKIRKAVLVMLVFVMLFTLSACGCEHEWKEATCIRPEFCVMCGEERGESLGHSYSEGYCIVCSEKDPNYVDLETFGFTNMYGMNVWIEVDGYSFEQGYATLDARLGPSLNFFYVDSGYYESYFIEFEQLVLGKADKEDCDLFVGNTVFTVSSNSIINTERGTWTIFDRRVYTAEEMLVLKTKFNGTEHWYVPIDLLDLTETTRDDEYTYFYFK